MTAVSAEEEAIVNFYVCRCPEEIYGGLSCKEAGRVGGGERERVGERERQASMREPACAWTLYDAANPPPNAGNP